MAVFFLSDDGPESSFLGTKKPQNRLIFCGLVLFRLLSSEKSPEHLVELEGLVPYATNAVISISYARSFFLCNEYVTNHFIHFSDGSLAVAARLDCECKYTKIQASSQVQGFDLEIFKPVWMTFITAFIERRR